MNNLKYISQVGCVKRSEPIIQLFTPLRHKGTKKNLVSPPPIPLQRGTQGEVATFNSLNIKLRCLRQQHATHKTRKKKHMELSHFRVFRGQNEK